MKDFNMMRAYLNFPPSVIFAIKIFYALIMNKNLDN